MPLLSTTKFSSMCQFKNQLNFFSIFRWKPWKPNVKFEKKTDKSPFNTFSIFFTNLFVYRKFFTDEYPSKYFLWTDTMVFSVSPWMNTIRSHDQFKPIRIWEIWRWTVTCDSIDLDYTFTSLSKHLSVNLFQTLKAAVILLTTAQNSYATHYLQNR